MTMPPASSRTTWGTGSRGSSPSRTGASSATAATGTSASMARVSSMGVSGPRLRIDLSADAAWGQGLPVRPRGSPAPEAPSGAGQDDEPLGGPGHRDVAVDRPFDAL